MYYVLYSYRWLALVALGASVRQQQRRRHRQKTMKNPRPRALSASATPLRRPSTLAPRHPARRTKSPSRKYCSLAVCSDLLSSIYNSTCHKYGLFRAKRYSLLRAVADRAIRCYTYLFRLLRSRMNYMRECDLRKLFTIIAARHWICC